MNSVATVDVGSSKHFIVIEQFMHTLSKYLQSNISYLYVLEAQLGCESLRGSFSGYIVKSLRG